MLLVFAFMSELVVVYAYKVVATDMEVALGPTGHVPAIRDSWGCSKKKRRAIYFFGLMLNRLPSRRLLTVAG